MVLSAVVQVLSGSIGELKVAALKHSEIQRVVVCKDALVSKFAVYRTLDASMEPICRPFSR